MPSFDIIKKTDLSNSFRVNAIKGKFDLQDNNIKEQFIGDIDLSKDWNIGVICGHSGTGKTTIANNLFDINKIINYNNEAIIDNMPENKSLDEITAMFNSVGFSSPYSWLKPYSVLSTGEKMRVDLAYFLLQDNDIIVFDEFTSVVDRNVARITSMAVSKTIKRAKKKFIAVSCHSDIIEYLEPDWVFNTNNMTFEYTRGLLRRPEIKLEIYKQKGLWNLFRKYHYLNHNLNHSAIQFVGYIDNVPCVFCAVLHFPHPKVINFKRITRLVVLPDYQGIGIGKMFLDYICNDFIRNGFRMIITTTTPALMKSFIKDNNWKLKRTGRTGRTGMKSLDKTISGINRFTTSWEYLIQKNILNT